MAYSFIPTPEKSPLSAGVKRVWVWAGVFAAVMLTAAAGFYLHNKEIRKTVEMEQSRAHTLALQIRQIEQQYAQYQSDQSRAQKNSTSNQLLADQTADLLELIPDDTLLSEFESNETALLYVGTTQDFEVLQTSLQRAFSGQYELIEIAAATEGNVTMFRLRFAVNGVRK